MTIAAAQYAQFRREAVAKGQVYTFTQKGDYLVFRIGEQEVVPFWSSESRLRRVQAQHPKYTAYSIESMNLQEFLDWLPELREEGVHIGVNWFLSRKGRFSGENFTELKTLLDKMPVQGLRGTKNTAAPRVLALRR